MKAHPGKPQAEHAKPSVSIVGPGSLGTALALSLHKAGYPIRTIVSREETKRGGAARALARRLKAEHVFLGSPLDSDLVWITVPDDAISRVALRLAGAQDWRCKLVLHSSGALSSEELSELWEKGAAVGSLHPMMTFPRGKPPSWRGVAVTFEGDEEAFPFAQAIVADLGGKMFRIERRNKVLYHAFASFASPLVIALMASMELVAQEAGFDKDAAKHMMVPLLRQTLANYLSQDAASAFTGPLQRGDVVTIRKHLEHLKRVPEAREVYAALARAALALLPTANSEELKKIVEAGRF